jgi:CDGSH-type Zn-finger protein
MRNWWWSAVTGRPDAVNHVTVTGEGPILVEGPVEIRLADGTTQSSDRMVVAICTCRRSKAYPFCDTSHRRRVRSGRDD